jgi:hypothetical protein
MFDEHTVSDVKLNPYPHEERGQEVSILAKFFDHGMFHL